jgi:Na+(H+)/acetate symporter ActP
MPDAAIGAIAFVTLLTIMVGARGIRVARTPDDFMVAARQVPPAINAAAISGEYLSAASFLGIAGLVVAQGVGALWYSVGYTAGYLVLLLLVAAPLRRFGAYTIPDFAVGRLGSRGLRQVATLLVLVIGWFYLLPQMKGAGITLQWVLGTPYWVGVAILGVVVSGNIAMGGMKGITFVQCFQYWLKLCAIGIPALVLLIATGHDSTHNLSPDHAPVFTYATVVNLTDATDFTLPRPAEVTVTGLLDQRTFRHQEVRLCACRYAAGAGTTIGFGVGAPVPVSLAMQPSSQESWDAPFLSSGTNGAHPLAATYGVIIATFFGAIGLPHILVRFYTNPDGEAARRTTLIVVLLLSTFYLFPAVLAVLTRLHAPQLYLSSDSDSVVLALPSLLLPGLPGEILAALVAAGAFAAFLSTSSGLLVSVAGALSHDFMKGGVTSFRWCALIAGAVATTAALLIDRFSLALLVGWAFAIAASSFCPLMVLGIWWRRLTRIGAAMGMLIGGGSCLAAIVASMLGAASSGWDAVLLGQPAIWTVPLAFAAMIIASLLTQPALPANVSQVMLLMHLPETLSRQAHRAVSQARGRLPHPSAPAGPVHDRCKGLRLDQVTAINEKC